MWEEGKRQKSKGLLNPKRRGSQKGNVKRNFHIRPGNDLRSGGCGNVNLRPCMWAGSLKSVPAPQSGTSSTAVEDGRAVLGLKYPRVDVGQDHGQLPPQFPVPLLCWAVSSSTPEDRECGSSDRPLLALLPPQPPLGVFFRILGFVLELGAHKGPKPENQEWGSLGRPRPQLAGSSASTPERQHPEYDCGEKAAAESLGVDRAEVTLFFLPWGWRLVEINLSCRGTASYFTSIFPSKWRIRGRDVSEDSAQRSWDFPGW